MKSASELVVRLWIPVQNLREGYEILQNWCFTVCAEPWSPFWAHPQAKTGICCKLGWKFCIGTPLLLLWLLCEQTESKLVFQVGYTDGALPKAFAVLTKYLCATSSLSSTNQAIFFFSMLPPSWFSKLILLNPSLTLRMCKEIENCLTV